MAGQSTSSSSAIIIGVFVREPCPSSGFSTRTTIWLSDVILSQALGLKTLRGSANAGVWFPPRGGKKKPRIRAPAVWTLVLRNSRRLACARGVIRGSRNSSLRYRDFWEGRNKVGE